MKIYSGKTIISQIEKDAEKLSKSLKTSVMIKVECWKHFEDSFPKTEIIFYRPDINKHRTFNSLKELHNYV